MSEKWTDPMAVTLTLHPAVYYMTAQEQYDYIKPKLGCFNDLHFSLVAELTKAGNIHLHGLVQLRYYNHSKQTIEQRIKDAMKRPYDKKQRSPFGFIQLKQLDDDLGWFDYIFKHTLLTNYELERSPIIIDDCDVDFIGGILERKHRIFLREARKSLVPRSQDEVCELDSDDFIDEHA